MTLRQLCAIGLVLPSLGILGCSEGRQVPPKTSVHVVHGAPTFGELAFLRVEHLEGTLSFKTPAAFSFDADQYNFNIEVTHPGSPAPERIRTFAKELVAGTDYAIVLTGVGGLIEPLILEYPTAESGAQVVGAHAGTGLPAMDVYLTPPGTDLTTVTPWGSVAFMQDLPAQTLTAGDYEITLTEPGNPANVLLASNALPLSDATSTIFTIIDEGGEGTSTVSVLAVARDSAIGLLDKDTHAAMRILNAAADGAARDVGVDGDLSPPLFAAAPFAAATDYESIPNGEFTIDVTPAGNPGVIEVEQAVTSLLGGLHTLFVAGEPGALSSVLIVANGRRLADRAAIQLYNAATQFTNIEFFLVAPGTDIDASTPVATLGSPSSQSFISIQDDYELVLRDGETQAILAGPQALTLDGGGLYALLAINGAAAGTADVVLLDDFLSTP